MERRLLGTATAARNPDGRTLCIGKRHAGVAVLQRQNATVCTSPDHCLTISSCDACADGYGVRPCGRCSCANGNRSSAIRNSTCHHAIGGAEGDGSGAGGISAILRAHGVADGYGSGTYSGNAAAVCTGRPGITGNPSNTVFPGRSSCSWGNDTGHRINLGLSSVSSINARIAVAAVGAIASNKAIASIADHHGSIALRRD